jgi:hypothetical protein
MGIDGKMSTMDYVILQAIRQLNGFLISIWAISHEIPKISITRGVPEM